VTTQADCSGTWQGEGTTCDPDACAPPPAVCGLPVLTCLVVSAAGLWWRARRAEPLRPVPARLTPVSAPQDLYVRS
jgi:hypothetical protein